MSIKNKTQDEPVKAWLRRSEPAVISLVSRRVGMSHLLEEEIPDSSPATMHSSRFLLQWFPHRSLLVSRPAYNAFITSHRRCITQNAPRRKGASSSAQADEPSRARKKGNAEDVVDKSSDQVIKAMEEEQDRLPFLQRPLGVREPPTTEPKSWKDEMLNQETRMDHRRKL